MLMTKKLLKIGLIVCAGILVILGGWMISNRMQYIDHVGTYDRKEVLLITDHFWVNVPNGRWLHLEEEGFKAQMAYVYVDSLNPMLRTYVNPASYVTDWRYSGEHGEPLILTVIEIDENDPVSFVYNTEELTIFEFIDGIEVGYNQPAGINPYEEGFTLHLKNEEKTIQLCFVYSQLEDLMPVLEKAWTIIKGE